MTIAVIMMNSDTEKDCTIDPLPFDVTAFPTVTSGKNFNFSVYAAQLSAAEELAQDEPIVLYEEPYPSIEEAVQAEKNIYNFSGDIRFTGLSAYTFLRTRYKPLDSTDLYASTSSTITATACDTEGLAYTYTMPNTAFFYDFNQTRIYLPAFDLYGRQIKFPLTNSEGKYLLTQVGIVTAYDANSQLIYFPLKDSHNNIVKYPFRDAFNSTIISPPEQNNDKLIDTNQAFEALDNAYENAKDADAYNFTFFILDIENTNKISFFQGIVETPVNIVNFFAAAVYRDGATDADLINITSDQISYFVRYHDDRSAYVYDLYKQNGGTGPYTIIQPTTSTVIADKVKSENERMASYNILSIPYWSSSQTDFTFSKKIVQNTIHTSVLDLYTTSTNNTAKIAALESQVSSLFNLVTTLSTKLDTLSTTVTAVSAQVRYNSSVIDLLTPQSVWDAIWLATIPPGVTIPVAPNTPGSTIGARPT